MRNFRQGGNSREGGFSRGPRSFGGRPGGFGGRSGGFGGRGGGRSFGGSRSSEMYDAICGKCGKNCQVPFKPTGARPVLCSDCFRGNDSSRGSFSSHSQSGSAQLGPSVEQFKQINAKLDKIIAILGELELDTDGELEIESDADAAEFESDNESDSPQNLSEDSDEDESEDNSKTE